MAVFLAVCAVGLLGRTFAAEVIPPSPDRYFNDYAHIASAGTAAALNQKLEDFEKESSSQVVVAIYPKMQSDSDIADYTNRVFRAWGIGQKKNNGAALFVFVNDRKMFIKTGYGLEGSLPDAICKRIIDTEIAPNFKTGNFDAGLTAGVDSIIAAAQGEYRGDGTTVDERKQDGAAAAPASSGLVRFIFSPLGFILIIIVLQLLFGRRRGTVYSSGGVGNFAGGMLMGSLMGGASSGGGGFSGGGGGGGGGFSGGGGSSGGGGAGGSW